MWKYCLKGYDTLEQVRLRALNIILKTQVESYKHLINVYEKNVDLHSSLLLMEDDEYAIVSGQEQINTMLMQELENWCQEYAIPIHKEPEMSPIAMKYQIMNTCDDKDIKKALSKNIHTVNYQELIIAKLLGKYAEKICAQNKK